MRPSFFFALLLASLIPACGGKTPGAGVSVGIQPSPISLPSDGSCQASTEPLTSWELEGSDPQQYQLGLDSSKTCSGSPSLHLGSSTATGSENFATAMSEITPGSYAGRRLRISAWVLSSSVSGWAGLWMRVDTSQETGVAFDNMQCRPIVGTTGWTQYQVVLDVTSDATNVAYGVLLADEGDVWIDGVRIEVVDSSVPTTGC
jgi:hypothetical protein